jgi:hypothetical protein
LSQQMAVEPSRPRKRPHLAKLGRGWLRRHLGDYSFGSVEPFGHTLDHEFAVHQYKLALLGLFLKVEVHEGHAQVAVAGQSRTAGLKKTKNISVVNLHFHALGIGGLSLSLSWTYLFLDQIAQRLSAVHYVFIPYAQVGEITFNSLKGKGYDSRMRKAKKQRKSPFN